MCFLNRFKRYIFSAFLLFVLDSWQVVLAQATEADLLKALKTTPKEDHDSIYYELFKVTYKDTINSYYALQAYSNSNNQKHAYRHAQACRIMGYSNKKTFETERIYYYEGLKVCHANSFTELLIDLYNDLGVSFERHDMYDSALANFHKALMFAEELKSMDVLAVIHNNIGLVYYNIDNIDEAIKNYNQVLDYKNKISSSEDIFANYTNLALAYNDVGEFALADSVIKIAKEISLIQNDDASLGELNYGIGYGLLKRRNYSDARKYFLTSYNFGKSAEHFKLISNSLFHLAEIDILHKKYINAINELNESEQLASALNSRRQKRDIYKLYAVIYDSLADYQKSNFYKDRYILLKDSIFNGYVIANISSMQSAATKVEFDKIINSKNLQLSRSQLIIILISVITALIGIVSVLLYKRYILNKRLKQILEKQVRLRTSDLVHNNSELKQLYAEYEMLLQQTSKYVKGPLATLMGLIELAEKDQDPERTQEYIVKIKKIASSMGLSLEQLKAIAELRVSDQENRRDLLKQNLVTQDQHN